jgi:peptidoglycan/xylan/chitin deacetylase (PgdA/CDA1 family)
MKPFVRLPLPVLACALTLLAAGCANGPGPPRAGVAAVSGERSAAAAAASSRTTGTPSGRALPAEGAATVPSHPPLDPARYLGSAVKRSRGATTAVALTLDDGPSNNLNTILGILHTSDARATFFFVGDRMPRWKYLMPNLLALGCEVGNHSWDHQEIEGVPREQVLREVDRAQSELTRDVGVAPVLMRPPVGHWDPDALAAVNSRGLVLALWSLHGQDTGKGTRSEKIARDVVRSARGGDVILLHETNIETVKALPTIIAGLRKKGLHLVTMSELLAQP